MKLKTGVLAILLLTGSSIAAWALESVNFTVVGADADEDVGAIEDSLRAASLSNTALEQEDTNTQDILGAAQSDYARYVSVLYQNGYFGPSISIKVDGQEAAYIDPFSPPKAVSTIDVQVNTGPSFRFGKAQIGPRPDKAEPTPIVAGFAKNDPADSTLVAAAANAGVNEWREHGHAKADVTNQSIVADHNKRRLNVDIELEPGPRLRFGTMTITGKTGVREDRIREIMGYPEGEIYSPTDLRKVLTRLRRTGVFSVAAVTEADEPTANGRLDYTLSVIDQKPRRLGFSGDLSTQDGISLSAFWLHRNLWGGAERLRIDASIDNIGGTAGGFGSERGNNGMDYSIGARLTNPAMFGTDNDGFAYGSFSYTDDPEYEETAALVGVGLNRHFDEKYYGEVSGGYRYSDVNDAFGHREFNLIVFPSRLEWENRDKPGNAKKGSYANLYLTPYAGVNGSESGAMADLDLRGYQGLGSKSKVVLAGRVQLGSVMGSSLSGTSPNYLFFSGGADTVRGQPYQSLGVDVGASQLSGGRSFVGLSGEVRADVTDSIGAVAFMDWGFVGPDSYYSDAGNSQSGLGVGVRYGTPIGPIRLDLATPYTGEIKEFSRVEIYIGIGQAF